MRKIFYNNRNNTYADRKMFFDGRKFPVHPAKLYKIYYTLMRYLTAAAITFATLNTPT